MIQVEMYTDGACSGNPGKGGWGVVLLSGAKRKELFGAEADTTNNRMELRAVIEGFKALKKPCAVTVYSDSAYVVNAFKEHWIQGWIRKGWRTTTGAVKNREVWEELLQAIQPFEVSWVKVKGHADNELNNRCDELARQAILQLL